MGYGVSYGVWCALWDVGMGCELWGGDGVDMGWGWGGGVGGGDRVSSRVGLGSGGMG